MKETFSMVFITMKPAQVRNRSPAKAGRTQISSLVEREEEAPVNQRKRNFTVPKQDSHVALYKAGKLGSSSNLKSPRTRTRSLKNALPSLKEAGEGKYQGQIIQISRLEDMDAAVDAFMGIDMPLHMALETFFTTYLQASEVCFWQDIASLRCFYSPTKRIKSGRDVGIAGAAFISRRPIRAPSAGAHPAYDKATDGAISGRENPVICFPLWDHQNGICGIVEAFRKTNSPFTDIEERFVEFFTRKFKLLSRWMKEKPWIDPVLFDMMQIMSDEQFLAVFAAKMPITFNCRRCELWQYSSKKESAICFSDRKTQIRESHLGIVGAVLRDSQVLNCELNKLHSAYDKVSDGEIEEAVIVMPVVDPSSSDDKYAIALRGPKGAPIFTADDEDKLKTLAPFIVLAMTNSISHSQFYDEYQKSHVEKEGLTALLEVAEVLGATLDIEKLTGMIMEKGCELTNADRCSLFLVNDSRDRLITSFHRGLENAIDIPINKGIVGKTVTENRILNIADAYEDPSFDASTDIETGYTTRSLLSIPIYNYRGEIIGVTEMVNKKDGKPFSQWDSKVIQIFNVFCGISLENATLYKKSCNMSQQIQSFFDASMSLSKGDDVRQVLSGIVHRACQVIGAERGSLFLVDPVVNVLKSYICDGDNVPETVPLDQGVAAYSVEKRESLIVNDCYHDPRFNRHIDSVSGFRTSSVCTSPIIGPNESVIGVVEMINKKSGEFTLSDSGMLQSFSMLVSLCLENNRLKDIVTLGNVEVELSKWIGESEKELTDKVPVRLSLTSEEQAKIRQLNFFAIEWDEIGKFKILFSLFHEFGLLKEFKITNAMFFRFLYEIRRTYHTVPYHNWIHAVDVSQYVSYEIRTAGLQYELTKFELLAILVAAVCHDAGHDGFNNIYNVKAETPLGILFKDTSVMETHHCSVAISILSRKECNLFHAISEEDVKKMWTLLITLILATDMAHHFKLVKSANEILESKSFDRRKPEHRILMMQLLLKVSDISNVSRPFKYADKWCDVLNLEFFRQGDNEKRQGFGLTSPLNDREHPDKPKSQIGFYNFICIPLYQAISGMCPELVVNLNSVKANLEVWKSMMPPPK